MTRDQTENVGPTMGHDHGDGNDGGVSLSPDSVALEDATRVYVRTDGSDSNSGLTEASAKATIRSAIDDAPIQSYEDPVVVDMQENATFTEEPIFDHSDPPLLIEGNGKSNTAIDGSADKPLDARGCSIHFKNLQLLGGNVTRAIEGARLKLIGAEIAGQSSRGLLVAGNSHVKFDSASGVDVTGQSASTGLAINNGNVDLQGYVRGGGSVCEIEENGVLFTLGAEITGEGTGSSNYAVALGESSYAKLNRDTTLQDCDVGVYSFSFGNAELESGITTNNLNSRVSFATSGGGFITDEEGGGTMMKIPGGTSFPSPANLGSSEQECLVYYDRGRGTLYFYDHINDQWMPAGVDEYPSAVASDLDPYEFGFDPDNSRALYKDSTGTVHYWTTDGTL